MLLKKKFRALRAPLSSTCCGLKKPFRQSAVGPSAPRASGVFYHIYAENIWLAKVVLKGS